MLYFKVFEYSTKLPWFAIGLEINQVSNILN